jgi:SWI/SNF-related matrix-associated actin-dependent regulator 1 of chromatin subfamily A
VIFLDVEIYDEYPIWVIKSRWNDKLQSYLRENEGYWDGENRVWKIEAREDIADYLIKKFGAIPSASASLLLADIFPADFAKTIRKSIEDLMIPNIAGKLKTQGLKKGLYPFQIEGIAKMSLLGGRVLLADEMGLGKTIQALAFCHYHRFKKILIVCPKNVVLNWRREIYETLDISWYEKEEHIENIQVEIISGIKPQNINADGKLIYYIVNYDIASARKKNLLALNTDIIILDESHYIKDPKTKRTKAIIELCKNFKYILAMTGTPILNRVSEIWNVIHLLKPDIFPKKQDFLKTFTYQNDVADSILAGLNDDDAEKALLQIDNACFIGGKDLDKLGQILYQNVMIRRTKKEVLNELPPKTRTMITLDLDETTKEEYQRTEAEFNELLKSKGISLGEFLDKIMMFETDPILVKLEEARQLALEGKITDVIQWIKDFLESDQKLVVFVHHRIAIKRLLNSFPKATVIQGGISSSKRQEAIDKFQNDPETQLIIVSITAGGEGINLTAANNAVIIETAWNPGKMLQAEDRIHRIGQEADSVNIWHMIAGDTVEEPIYNLIFKKQEIIDQVMRKVVKTNGHSIQTVIEHLNMFLNPLGIEVKENFNLIDVSLTDFSLTNMSPLIENTAAQWIDWLTLSEAEEYARSQGSKITRANLTDDIYAGRLQKDIDVVWVKQPEMPKGGRWRIKKEALDRRIEERKRGRGRPKNVKSQSVIKLENQIREDKMEVVKAKQRMEDHVNRLKKQKSLEK